MSRMVMVYGSGADTISTSRCGGRKRRTRCSKTAMIQNLTDSSKLHQVLQQRDEHKDHRAVIPTGTFVVQILARLRNVRRNAHLDNGVNGVAGPAIRAISLLDVVNVLHTRQHLGNNRAVARSGGNQSETDCHGKSASILVVVRLWQ